MFMKILSATSLAALGLLAGCSSSPTTVQDNSVAAQFARSMPYGVTQNGQAVTAAPAANSLPAQVVQNLAAAQAARNTPGNSNAGAVPTLPELLAAVRKARLQMAAQQQQQQQAQSIGPGAFITGTSFTGTSTDANGNTVVGLPPLSTQFVPAVGP